MLPIVQEFINTREKLLTILSKHYDKNQHLESVFFKFLSRFKLVSVIDEVFSFELDQAFLKGHPDPDSYMLFLASAIDLFSRRNQFERVKVYLSIGDSISHKKIHPVVFSYYTVCNALFNFCENKDQEGDLNIKKSLDLIDKKCPRYLTILLAIAEFMAVRGQLNDMSLEDKALIDANSQNYSYSVISHKLTNAIFVGNLIEGYVLLEEYKKSKQGDSFFYTEGKEYLLKILSGNFEENNYRGEKYKLFAKICSTIISSEFEKSFQNLQSFIKSDGENTIQIPFFRYTQLHLELCMRNLGKARLLFHELAQKSGIQYLDDFFLARIQLLENNRDGANESFRRLIDNVKKYGAVNRLVFELQFAKELKPTDIFLLMNEVSKEVSPKANITKKELPVIPLNPEKGVKLLIGNSTSIKEVKSLIKKFASLKEPVLITGETGTGKELVSRAIHEEGEHYEEPFLAINCGALTDSLLESELFGYEAGAFTGAQKEHKGIFEAAGKGTVFLDEFGDISPKMQVSLLRVLESNEIRLIGGTKTRQVNCKIVIATNIDLQKAVENKKFREDLYFRLNRFDIKLPPLRERPEDVPLLIDYFLKDQESQNGRSKSISNDLLEALTAYQWPGNIRELKNEMERLKILHSDKQIITIDDFDFTHLQGNIPNINKKVDVLENKEAKPSLVKNEKMFDENRILKIVQKGSKAEIRHEFIKEQFKKFKKLTRRQIIEIAMISPLTATRDLQILCKAGFIEKIKPTNSVQSHFFQIVD